MEGNDQYNARYMKKIAEGIHVRQTCYWRRYERFNHASTHELYIGSTSVKIFDFCLVSDKDYKRSDYFSIVLFGVHIIA